MSILQMNIYGSLLIVFMIIIRSIAINKLPKKVFVVLWLIAVSRLLIPYTMPQIINLYPVINTLNEVSGDRFTAAEPQYEPIQLNAPDISGINAQINENRNENGDEAINQVAAAAEKINISIYAIIWLAGIFAFAVFFIAPHIIQSRKYRAALPIEDDYIASWIASHRLFRKYKIMLSDEIVSPFTYGIFRPVILMSENIDINNRELADYILTHEYIHIKRYDVVLKWLSAFTLCISWFNPLVWVMYILMNRDIELSCDEGVVRLKGEISKKSYAMTLLDMESKKASFNPLVSHFNKNSLKERVTAVMKIKKITIFSVILAFAMIISSTMILITSCSDTSTPNTDEEETTASTTEKPAEEVVQEYIDPYADVRFGETRDTLLLDVEWHTYDTWLEEIQEYKNIVDEQRQSEYYMNLSDEEKNEWDMGREDWLKMWEEVTDSIREEKYYLARLINGKEASSLLRKDRPQYESNTLDISQGPNSDGYYIMEIYPYNPYISYTDEEGIFQIKYFESVYSKREFDFEVEYNITPFCDDLLTKGLITQEEYNKAIQEPLEKYVEMFFS